MIRSRAMGTVFVVIGMATGLSWSSEPKLRLEFAATRPEIPVLSWDTEGGPRVETNLVCSGSAVGLRVRVDGAWSPGARFPPNRSRQLTGYHLSIVGRPGCRADLEHGVDVWLRGDELLRPGNQSRPDRRRGAGLSL